MHVAELKKLNTRFYSEVLRKKFFVLYEDSRQSLTNPRDHHSDVSLKAFKIVKMLELLCKFKTNIVNSRKNH